MISYTPLMITLAKKGIKINQLEKRQGGVIHEKTVSKLKNNLSVNIDTIAIICAYLDVPIEEVVEVVL